MSARCDQCRHWQAPDEDDPDSDWRDDKAGAGECKAIRPVWHIEEEAVKGMTYPSRPESEPIRGEIPPARQALIDAWERRQIEAIKAAGAFVVDGSSYYAALKTQPDFYCAKFTALA